jgi:hypothetical protein
LWASLPPFETLAPETPRIAPEFSIESEKPAVWRQTLRKADYDLG